MYSNNPTLIFSKNRKDLKPPLLLDPILLAVTIALVLFSIVMIYSTTGVTSQEKFGDSLYYVKKQGVAALLGFVLMYIFAKQLLDFYRRISVFMYPLCLGLLLLTYIPGLGSASGGAQRWLNLGGLNLQPAEFVKVCFVIFIAGFFARQERNLESFTTALVIPMVYFAPIALLLLLQPDFGSTAILTMVILAMALAAGVKLRHILVLGGTCLAMLGALIVISPYRMTRVLTFLSPMQDVQGKGYQLTQSLITVAGGNWTGTGLGGSVQKLFFLPAAHTDFIYAVIAEEWGFLGAVTVLAAFLIFLARGLKVASRLTDDTFSFSLTVGLTLLIVAPALINMGVVTGLLPTKGLVLPLLGYGGSSIMTSLAIVGILLALARESRIKI